MRKTVFALAVLAASVVAAPAVAQSYIAYTTIDNGEAASITFVNAAFSGGDLTYNITGNGLLRVQEPRVPVIVKVRFADGTGYSVTTTLSAQNAVRSTYDPSTRYWCVFVGRKRFSVNVDALCARYAQGDTSVYPTD